LSRELTALAEQKQGPDASDLLTLARRSWLEAGKFSPPTGANPAEADKSLKAEFARVDKLLAERAARLDLLEELRLLAARGSADAVAQGRALAKNAGLLDDPEVKPLLEESVQAHRAKVVFTEAKRATGGPT